MAAELAGESVVAGELVATVRARATFATHAFDTMAIVPCGRRERCGLPIALRGGNVGQE